MNKILAATVPVALMVMGTTAFAQSGEESTGFSGRIAAGAAYISTTDQLFARGDQSIDSLDDSGDRSGVVFPLVLFDLRYLFSGSGTEVFLGTPLESDAIGLTLGVGRSWEGIGKVEVAAVASPWSQAWDDPYRTDGDRDETWARQYGLKVDWQGIAGSGFQVGYAGVHTDVDHDEAGGRFDALRRDGWSHEFSLGYRKPVGPGLFLVPEAAVVVGDLDGEAEAFRGYQGKLAFLLMRPRVILNLEMQAGWTRYDAEHPLFDERRDERSYGGAAIVTLPGLFGMQRLYANVVGVYGMRNANLDFFDANTAVGLVALGYQL